MTIIATMYYKKNKFQEKKSKLTVKQQLGKEMKSVGQVELDLADFCGAAGESEQVRPLTLKLQKCSDRQAFIVCTMRSKMFVGRAQSQRSAESRSSLPRE